MKKRLLAWLLTLVMLLALLPTAALAANEEGTQENPWNVSAEGADNDVKAYLKLNEDQTTYTLVFSGVGATKDYAKDTDRPWNGNDTITDIVVENGITYMGDRLVQGLPATHISIPASVGIISELSLGRMTSLQEIELDKGNAAYRMEDGILFTSDMKTLVKYPALKEGGSYTVPDSVTRLGHHAFSGTANLTELALPDTLEEIGRYAFAETTGIDTLVIPNSVTKLEASAISGNRGLKRVIIGSGVTAISESLCYNSQTIEEVMFAEGSHLTAVGTTAFRQCTALKSVELPETVETIGASAFQGCTALTSVSAGGLPVLESIGRQAFRDCGSLTNFKFGPALQTIGDSAFLNCSSLEEVLIDGQITSIGTSAFNGCSSVKKISIVSNTDLTINQSAFASNISAKTICVGSNNGNVTLGTPGSTKGSIASGAEFDAVKFFGNRVLISCESLLMRSANSKTASAYSMIDFTGAKSVSYGGVYPNKFIWYMRPTNNDGVLYVDSKDAATALESVLSGSTRGRYYAVTDGGVFLDGTKFEAGKLADPFKAGYRFEGWFDNDEYTGEAFKDTLSAVTKNDQYQKTYYAKWLELPLTGITVQPKQTEYVIGTTLTRADFIVTANYNDGEQEIVLTDGYNIEPTEALTTLGDVEVTAAFGGKTATCTIKVVPVPVEPVTPVIPVTPSAPAKNPFNPDAGKTKFTDVSDNAWYASAVNYAVDKGLMNGTGDNKFSPEAATTRGMIVTILARLDGKNTSGTPWYLAGQRWAMEYEISDGTNMTSAITREQLVTMLFRYAVKNGLEAVTLAENLSRFTDASDVSSWAVPAMQWAVGQGLIQGSNGLLRPQANASRAEVATILMRFCELINK